MSETNPDPEPLASIATSDRRTFLGMITGLTAMGALTLSTEAAKAQAETSVENSATSDEHTVALWIGPDDDKADVDTGDRCWYRYDAVDTGTRYYTDPASDAWHEIPMEIDEPTTQVEEVRTEDFRSFFNHTFARPGAPDDKNWTYTSADVTKVDSEIELASTTTLHSTQRGNYPPGTEAIPGVAWRVTGTPTAGSADAGYFDADNGFGAGEDATDSYVFVRKAGSTHKVYRADWNGHVPDARVWQSDAPVVTRFPHLFYGGGSIRVRALVHADDQTTLETLHTFTPDNVPSSFDPGPPFDQPNLPIQFESGSLSGGSLRANAAHYEFGEQDAENRVNGEHFGSISAGSTGWTPLLAWRKRSGWDMVNVKPLKVTAAAASNNARLALQLNPTLSGGSWGLPTNASTDETAVEVNTNPTLDATGERRWVGFATAGQGSSANANSEDLTFNLPADEEVVLVAQGVGGSADVSGVVAWEEFF